ncbi:tetratricopeptide repeat protein [Bacteroides sp. UBA939]|uniref:tetratricopeptide repeat protein n=1 Tax=Bacteroides sp. UBA939 TaxID=1946092 RepID=UPI0025C48FEE|nr:hypothetical protein [Bacteroides sp. UBA939]
MKHLFYIIVCLLSVSCVQQHTSNVLLVQADSLMQTLADSALHILESIDPQRLETPGNHAYYALLLTQARDKNYVVQTDDSLIRMAVQYYDSIKDASMQAKAYFYLGCIYRDANQSGEAVKEYLTALPFAEKTRNAKLAGQIYHNAGYLYFIQNLMTEADSIFQLSEKTFIQLNDTTFWAEALSYQGQISIEKGEKYYPKAEQKLVEALKMTTVPKYRRIHSNVTASLSSLYSRMGEKEKCIQYAKLNISLLKDSARLHRAYLLLGDAYFKSKLYDSATIYINKSLSSPRYRIKTIAYARLAEIAKKQGDIKKSLDLTEKYTLYKDSIHLTQQSNNIINAEKEVEKQQYTDTLKQQHNKQSILIIVSIFLTGIIGIICILLRRYKSKTRDLEDHQSHLKQELAQLNDEIAEKEKSAILLQEQIEWHQANEKERKRLQQELEATNKERDALAKQQDALAKEALEYFRVYKKIEKILDSYEKYDESEEQLNEEDWKTLIAATNSRWDNIIMRISSQYNLSETEIQLCCMALANLSTTDIAYLIGCSKHTIYRREDDIFAKFGHTKERNTLSRILKKI